MDEGEKLRMFLEEKCSFGGGGSLLGSDLQVACV